MTTPPPPPRSRRAARAALRVALGLVAGCAIAEGAFWLRDAGAFPHVNVYVPDAELGVRLRPGGAERIRFSKNPVTTLRINSEGYRGADWPAPAAHEVVVVGDSQVLGLGVEEDQTFSAALGRALGEGTFVRNLGVPTYGPREYLTVLRESLAKRKSETVIFTVNLSNDLFEATRPNTTRHAVWDGWAVRKETAPAAVTAFPGRSLLFTRSHAVYALRQLAYRQQETAPAEGFASEGTWVDIARAASAAEASRAAAAVESARLADLRKTTLRYAEDEARVAERALDSHVYDDGILEALGTDDGDRLGGEYVQRTELLAATRLGPGDILETTNGEESRSVRVNAEHIRKAAAVRRAFEAKLQARASAKNDATLLALFAKRDAAARKVVELRTEPPPRPAPVSPLAPVIAEAKAVADAHGARLVVVALPVDVQVSATEWAKYGAPPVDMEPTRILNADVVAAAVAHGAEGLDVLPALAAAEPGAFLDGDLHMTPKGHEAVARAIAAVLKEPRPVVLTAPLPAKRSWPPRADEWTPESEIAVRESDPAGCATKVVREWLGVFCRAKGGAKGVQVASGVEVTAGAVPGAATLIAPLVPGQDLRATFVTHDGARRELRVTFPETAEAPQIGFSKPLGDAGAAPGPGPAATAFCACFTASRPGATCAESASVPDADCERTYGADCTRLLACAAGDPASPPRCATGFAPAGAAQRCRPTCDDAHPCATGRCSDFRGARVCL